MPCKGPRDGASLSAEPVLSMVNITTYHLVWNGQYYDIFIDKFSEEGVSFHMYWCCKIFLCLLRDLIWLSNLVKRNMSFIKHYKNLGMVCVCLALFPEEGSFPDFLWHFLLACIKACFRLRYISLAYTVEVMTKNYSLIQ